jgi:hypothetical protein
VKTLSTRCIIFLIVLLAAGCVSTREYGGEITQVGKNKIVLVGRIELMPALEKSEQNLYGIGLEMYRNALMFCLDNKIMTYDEIPPEHLSDFVRVYLGQDFFIKQNYQKKVYISCQLLIADTNIYPYRYMYFPGVITIEIPEDSKVVYIGTIRYYRDIYSAITKVDIIDDYAEAQTNLREKYKEPVEMGRAKVTFINATD